MVNDSLGYSFVGLVRGPSGGKRQSWRGFAQAFGRGRRFKLRAARALQPSDAGTNLPGSLVPGDRTRNHYSRDVVVFCYRENPGFSRKRAQRASVEPRTTPDVATGASIRACNSPRIERQAGCHPGSRRPVTPIMAGERCGARGSSHRGRYRGRAESQELRCLTQGQEGALAHRRSVAGARGTEVL